MKILIKTKEWESHQLQKMEKLQNDTYKYMNKILNLLYIIQLACHDQQWFEEHLKRHYHSCIVKFDKYGIWIINKYFPLTQCVELWN
jgi:hypothetical protein